MSWIENIYHKISRLWRAMRSSSRFHSFLMFLGFVVIASIFWLVMALNDSVQNNYTVKIEIANRPDSVTFISDVPSALHVTVRDRGSNLLRTAIISRPILTLNYREYANDGIFRVNKTDLDARLKATFSASSVILSSSIDSLNLVYTTNKGKRVPVVVIADISPAAGKYLNGQLTADPASVMVYGQREVLDTLTRVFTDRLVKRDVVENESFQVSLKKIKGVRLLPNIVKVPVKVEPLVNKTEVIPIHVVGVPNHEKLLLFPTQVTVEYFVPMSKFSSDAASGMSAEVNYTDAVNSQSGKVHVRLAVTDKQLINPHLQIDSVEYTIVY